MYLVSNKSTLRTLKVNNAPHRGCKFILERIKLSSRSNKYVSGSNYRVSCSTLTLDDIIRYFTWLHYLFNLFCHVNSSDSHFLIVIHLKTRFCISSDMFVGENFRENALCKIKEAHKLCGKYVVFEPAYRHILLANAYQQKSFSVSASAFHSSFSSRALALACILKTSSPFTLILFQFQSCWQSNTFCFITLWF